MIYGVFSFLSFFIQPCPKNSLSGKQIKRRKKGSAESVYVFLYSPQTWTAEMWWHLLIWDDLKHHMVQQSKLFCNLQCWVALKGLGLPSWHLGDMKQLENDQNWSRQPSTKSDSSEWLFWWLIWWAPLIFGFKEQWAHSMDPTFHCLLQIVSFSPSVDEALLSVIEPHCVSAWPAYM